MSCVLALSHGSHLHASIHSVLNYCSGQFLGHSLKIDYILTPGSILNDDGISNMHEGNRKMKGGCPRYLGVAFSGAKLSNVVSCVYAHDVSDLCDCQYAGLAYVAKGCHTNEVRL